MKASLLTVILTVLLLGAPGNAQVGNGNFDVNDDAQMDLRYDWIVNVVVNDSNYVAYPESTLKPLTQLVITYRINPRFKQISSAGQYLNYEELWYHAEQAVGSRRFTPLNIPATYQGAIRIVSSEATSHSDKPVAGAIVRLFLDLGLQNCPVTVAFVPTNIFQAVITDLRYFHFYTNPPQNNSNVQTLAISLSSNPMGTTQSVYYQP